jgi:hypothetical protein
MRLATHVAQVASSRNLQLASVAVIALAEVQLITQPKYSLILISRTSIVFVAAASTNMKLTSPTRRIERQGSGLKYMSIFCRCSRLPHCRRQTLSVTTRAIERHAICLEKRQNTPRRLPRLVAVLGQLQLFFVHSSLEWAALLTICQQQLNTTICWFAYISE